MADPNDFNAQVIAEFRANKGVVGGPFKGANMVLLTSKGAKSGEWRTTPLVYLPDGDRVVIIASKGGAPAHPSWYHNLVANPTATIEVGEEKYEATATEAKGTERDDLYARMAAKMSAFAEYQQKTTRKIPVVVLTRK